MDGSSSSPERGKHSAPIETAQMSVLGRDGRDLEAAETPQQPTTSSRAKKVAAMASSSQWRPPTPTRSNDKESSWWDGITTTASRWKLKRKGTATAAHEALEAAYSSFEDNDSLASSTPTKQQQQQQQDRFVGERRHSRQKYSRVKHHSSSNTAATLSLLQPQLEEGVAVNHASDNTAPMTREDKLRQDCSFFYRDMDDEMPSRNSNRRSKRRSTTITSLMNQDRQAFTARYDQLNAKHVVDSDDDLELYLDEELDPNAILLDEPASPQFPRVADFSNSSLFYKQDGKILMRLPQDNIKLVMDPHLEAGILSMESSPYTTSEPWKHQDLTYCLTVDEDLYRRVVKEMADSYKTPCGLYYCCQEAESSGHVHIWVAVLILFCFMVFLLVNTIIFPLD